MAGLDHDTGAATPAVDLNTFLSPASFWLPERIVTSAWLQHAPFAFWLMDALRPRRLVELGTHHGFSYLAFCQAARRLGLDARLFAVDTWAGDAHAGVYPEQVLRDLQAYHDPRFADFSRLVRGRFDEAVVHFEDGSVDLLHVDGRHFYEDAREDYELWRPKLSDRAVVLFHDTNVRERGFGVWRLWAELAGRHPSFEFSHGHGLGVLGVGADLPPRLGGLFAAGAAHRDVVRETYFRLGAAVEDRLAVAARPAPQAPAAAPPAPRPASVPAAARTAPDLHIHLAAMAPQFLDVRTRLPLAELAKVPGIATSLSERKIELPRLPVDQPKVLVLQRAGMEDLEVWRQGAAQIREKGWVLITELDDHPELVAAVHNTSVGDDAWRSVRLAQAVQTSTEAMAAAIRPHNPEVTVFPNCAFALGPEPRRPSPDGRMRVFFGALNRERFSRRIGAALAGFAARHREVEFTVVHDRAFFDALGDGSKIFHPAQGYEGYLGLMGGCDVLLTPIEGGPGEAYKSDVKWVEASSLGLATVASPLVYAGSICDGETGVLAADVADWSRSLESLHRAPELRLRVATAARDHVARHRMFATQVPMRLAWYHDLWGRRYDLRSA